MKSIRNVLAPLFILGGFVALFSLLHAQDTATQTTAPDSVVQLTAESNGLSLVSPSDLPDAGTFWVVDTNGVLSPNPCPPPNAASLPIYGIADNEFLVDATGGQVSTDGQSVQDALTALADAVNNLISQVQTALAPQTLARAFGMSAAMDSPSDASPLLATFDTSGLYLQITNVSNGLAYLNLMNGTDYVYEIYSKTDFSATNWNIAGEVFPAGTNLHAFHGAGTGPNESFCVGAGLDGNHEQWQSDAGVVVLEILRDGGFVRYKFGQQRRQHVALRLHQ